MKYKAVGTDNH